MSTTVVIHVSDLDIAIQYYTDLLDFTFDFRFGDYAGLFNGNANINLSGPTHPGLKKTPGNAHLCIDCDEVDTYYDLIKKRGALIIVPIANRDYGIRDFAINDPDGNTLVFGKALV